MTLIVYGVTASNQMMARRRFGVIVVSICIIVIVLGLDDSQVDSLVEDNSDFICYKCSDSPPPYGNCLTIPVFPLPLFCGEIFQDQCLWTRLMMRMMKLSIGVVVLSQCQLVRWAHSLCGNWQDCFSPLLVALPWRDVL